VVLLASALDARAQTQGSTDALASWVVAVRTHEPGKPDSAAALVAALKYSDRIRLHPAMQLFLTAVRGQAVATRTDPQRRILELFRSVRTNPGVVEFFERAAVLHADAAMLRDKSPWFTDDAPSMPADPRSGRRETPSSLLSNETAAIHTDGQVIGEMSMNWNWPFARSLLDLVIPPAPRRAAKGTCAALECAGSPDHTEVGTVAVHLFVGDWYHAAAAYMLATGHHAELRAHFDHAFATLPEDARLLFDRGCFAETLGLPLYQVLFGDPGYWNARLHISLNVPPAEQTNGEAEALFRRAIAIDPSYAEARVRMARLMNRRGLHDEAAAQIDQALLAASRDKTVAYFAHLIGGRIALSRGRASDSLGQFRAALAVFPNAQSALLGASHAAVIASDLPAALSFVQRLGELTASFEADPWWQYHLGAGREVDDLMAAVWSHVRD
jgi:tetratricopeptide (TPR) repeat protein